jgi:serine/threonine-protein kinase
LAKALQDRYRLERELGQGGMATVYLAHDLKHDRDVALKVLRPELAAVLGAERFLREIQLTAKLQHPHIVTLIDSGDAGGALYYVLPYIEGESLRQELTREGQLPLDEVLRVTRAVAGALQYAHDRGVIHRDIKPENILLSRGEPVVADFGIALAAASAGRERLTETGLSLGTPAYMSPEQASAEPRLDGRSDQYSLACVVYEMLAGEPPYTGATAQAIIAKRLSEPVPKLGTLRQVPAGVEAAVTRALAKRPADRYGTVAEFAEALVRRAAPPRRRLSTRVAMLLGGAVVLGLIGLLAWMLRPAPPAPAMATRQLTFTGRAQFPAISRDGKWAAYFTGDSVMVQEVSGGQPVLAVRGGFAYGEPQWSTSGEELVSSLVLEGDSVPAFYAVPRLGGTPVRLADAGLGEFNVISEDGGQTIRSRWYSDTISITQVANGEITHRMSVGSGSHAAWRIPMAPDGRWIAFGGEAAGVPFLGLVSSDGSIRRRLVDWVDRGAVRWNPRGDAIYFEQRVAGGADLMKVRIDRASGERLGEPARVWSHAPFGEFSLANDGRTLAYQRDVESGQVWALDIDGPAGKSRLTSHQVTSGTSLSNRPDISPDGTMVAFERDETLERKVYVAPVAGGPARLIGATRSDAISPRWSPDSRRLAFVPPDSSVPGLMIAEIGGGRPSRVGAAPLRINFWSPIWSNSGDKLLYATEDPRKYVLLSLTGKGDSSIVLPDSMGWLTSAVFSPDDRELMATAIAGGHAQLWGLTLRTGSWTRAGTPDGVFLKTVLLWAGDGWIYSQRGSEIWRMRSDGRGAELYARLPATADGTQWGACRLTRNARRLACEATKSESDIWVATDFDPGERR